MRRDYANLAIALCSCVNIPARYCTGYLGDRWYTFNARNNMPRIGRVLIACGRDACDVAVSNTFGPNRLERFKAWTEVVSVS